MARFGKFKPRGLQFVCQFTLVASPTAHKLGPTRNFPYDGIRKVTPDIYTRADYPHAMFCNRYNPFSISQVNLGVLGHTRKTNVPFPA